MTIKKYEVGQKVVAAHFEGMVFEITAYNYDGSYNIQTTLDNQQILSYQFVSYEMLQAVDAPLT